MWILSCTAQARCSERSTSACHGGQTLRDLPVWQVGAHVFNACKTKQVRGSLSPRTRPPAQSKTSKDMKKPLFRHGPCAATVRSVAFHGAATGLAR